MHVCIYACMLWMYVYTDTCVYVCIYIYIEREVYVYIHTHACMQSCRVTYMHTCIHTHIYICIYIYILIYIYMYLCNIPPPGPVRRARNTNNDTAKHTPHNNHNIRHAQACIPNRSQLTRAQGFPSSQDGTQTSPTVKTVPLSSDEGRATQLHIHAPAH